MKPFDKDMFDKVDRAAREATKDYIASKGYRAIDNPNKYGADLIVPGIAYVECECKLVWGDEKFPWTEVNLPQRKDKFNKLELPCMFFVWNKSFTRCVKFNTGHVQRADLVEVSNKYIESGEKFFKVKGFEEVYA
jgi:hypothetical protein